MYYHSQEHQRTVNVSVILILVQCYKIYLRNENFLNFKKEILKKVEYNKNEI